MVLEISMILKPAYAEGSPCCNTYKAGKLKSKLLEPTTIKESNYAVISGSRGCGKQTNCICPPHVKQKALWISSIAPLLLCIVYYHPSIQL